MWWYQWPRLEGELTVGFGRPRLRSSQTRRTWTESRHEPSQPGSIYDQLMHGAVARMPRPRCRNPSLTASVQKRRRTMLVRVDGQDDQTIQRRSASVVASTRPAQAMQTCTLGQPRTLTADVHEFGPGEQLKLNSRRVQLNQTIYGGRPIPLIVLHPALLLPSSACHVFQARMVPVRWV